MCRHNDPEVRCENVSHIKFLCQPTRRPYQPFCANEIHAKSAAPAVHSWMDSYDVLSAASMFGGGGEGMLAAALLDYQDVDCSARFC